MPPPQMKISHLSFLLLSRKSKLSTHDLYIPNKNVHPSFHYRLNYTILVVSPYYFDSLPTYPTPQCINTTLDCLLKQKKTFPFKCQYPKQYLYHLLRILKVAQLEPTLLHSFPVHIPMVHVAKHKKFLYLTLYNPR